MGKNLRIIFTDKADIVLSDILKGNGLEEGEEEFFSKLEQEEEPKETIVRGAAIALAKKVLLENKLAELLQKHLEITKEAAEKIVRDIKSKLLPLLLVYPSEKFNDPVFREEISKTVFGDEKSEQKSVLPYAKKIEITDVEKNAEKIKKEKKLTEENKNKIVEESKKKFGGNKFVDEKRGPDTYREPIE